MRIDRQGWLAMAMGLFLAAVVLTSSFLTYISGFFATMVHELGHTISGWLYGYPSLPTFDILNGGGVTLQRERIWWVAAIVMLGFIWYLLRFYRNRLILLLLAGAFMIYCLTTLTASHQGIILSAGHAAELLFAGILLYRALSGSKISRAFQRPLYAFIGLFVILDNVRFSYLLAFDDLERHKYEAAQGMGFQMDFTRLADHYTGTSVATIAVIFLVLCLATPLVSYLCLRQRHHIEPVVARLQRRSN